MHAPETQSTGIAEVPGRLVAERLRRDRGLPGKTRVSQELRPAMPVVISGKVRAEG